MKGTNSILYSQLQESDQQFRLNTHRNLFVSDFSTDQSPKKTLKSTSPRKQWIKTATESHTFVIKTGNLLQIQNRNTVQRIFRRCLFVIRACLRLMILVRVRQEKPLNSPRKNETNADNLKQQILNEVVFRWCKGICRKAISSIKVPIYDYLQNPFNKVKTDISKMQLINAIKFLFESLAYYTHSHYIHYDLKGYLESQLYQDYKLYFTQYVSERTSYKIAILDELDPEEAALISMEIIIYNLSESLIQEQSQSNFCKIILISVLQYLFKKQFNGMITRNTNKPHIQGVLKIIDNNLKLTFRSGTSDSKNLIDGINSDLQIESLLEYNKKQMNKIQSYFNLTLKHLEQQIS